MACEMSTDVDGIRVIRHTAEQLEQLAPEVVHAAMLLCLRPESGEAQRNMEEFKKLWLDKVSKLSKKKFLALTNRKGFKRHRRMDTTRLPLDL